jgi:hypothetical protein
MIHIETRVEKARGCGYRKGGGIYLVAGGIGSECCKLPFELSVCPCCSAGIKQTRGFTWVSSDLFGLKPCFEPKEADTCPMNIQHEKVGLLWVGEKFYPTADHFTKEANAMGVSKRIAQVPHDFEVGKTWIYLAHPKAMSKVGPEGLEFGPGVFRAFKPERIEYVVTGKETEEELERMAKRGFTLVKVIRDIDQQMQIDEPKQS